MEKRNKKYDEISSYETKILFKEKMSELENLKYENDNIKNQINERQNRFQKRENEYKELINELKEEYETRICNKFNYEKKHKNLNNMNYQINENIESIKNKTYRILAEQEKDIIRFYNSKIKEIKIQFDNEKIKKGKKDLQFLEKETELIKELEWVKDISKKIDDENHNWMKDYMELNTNYNNNEIEYEELLSHLIFLKKKNAILFSKYSDLKKIFLKIKNIDLEEEKKCNSQVIENNITNDEYKIKEERYLNLINKIKILNKKLENKNYNSKLLLEEFTYKNKLKKIVIENILEFIKNKKKLKFKTISNELYNNLTEKDKNNLIDNILELYQVKDIVNDKIIIEENVLNDLKGDINFIN